MAQRVDGATYLVPNNPRLLELRERYQSCDSRVITPLVWTDQYVNAEDILRFRADNAYVWQLRGDNMHETAYALTEFYVKTIDRFGLLDKLTEDQSFGVSTFKFDVKPVSRDLLDSIMEIYFLEKHLGILSKDSFRVLDIGSGYGRLAHRMCTAAENLSAYLCTDAVAVSTFICEYYLSYHGLSPRARAVPLDEIDAELGAESVDLAINVHSFPECTIAAIDWWLSLLEKRAVRYLMVVPNALWVHGEQLITNEGVDFGKVIEDHGYQLLAKEPKFRDPIVQKYGIGPTYHYLFESK